MTPLIAAGCLHDRPTTPAPPAPAPSPGTWTLTALSGDTVSWQPALETRAVVFVFLATECPISNRVQPELSRLAGEFEPVVAFLPVYPNDSEDAGMIRRHREDFHLPPEAYRDPQQRLANALGATVTPEVVVLTPDGRLIYRGRVHDQFSGLGSGRPVPVHHDLEDVLTAHLAGAPAIGKVTPAAGCRIERAP